MIADRRSDRFGVFANPTATARSWYPAMRSRELRRGRIRSFDLRNRRLAVFRDRDGRAHAIDARCPHLGADLTLGTVEGSHVRCAFHGWCIGADGRCQSAPTSSRSLSRSVRFYPCEERWGLIWIFNGPTAAFALPSPDQDCRWWSLTLPPQRVACHPHLVLANGLDISHYGTLHDMTFTSAPDLVVAGHEVSVTMRGRPRSAFWRFVSGTHRGDVVARFTTIGGSLAWTTVTSPLRFHVLFSGRPDRDGRCVTRTIMLFPRAFNADCVRALGLMAMLLHDDRRILDTIDFKPDFDDGDEPLRAFARVVEGLGAW